MIGTEIHNFNTLYTKFYRKSFLFTKSYVHDECIAEDIVSDVLIKLWEILKEKEIEHIEALLLTTLKNKSLDHLKHEAIKTEALHSLTDMKQRELDIRISTRRHILYRGTTDHHNYFSPFTGTNPACFRNEPLRKQNK